MSFIVTPVATSISYIVGGTLTASFPVTFPFDEPGDLRVFVNGAPTDAWSLTGGTIEEGFYTTANVLLVVGVSNATVILARLTALEQLAKFPQAGRFSTETLNAELGRLWMAQQDRDRTLNQAVRGQEGESLLRLPVASLRANNFLGFDAAGAPKIYPRQDNASIFGASLVAAETSAAARDTLGLGGPLAGFRNLIINGNPIINQRNYVPGTPTVTGNQYTLDRWRVIASGQNLTWGDEAGIRTVNAPVGGMQQVIEGLGTIGGLYTINWVGTATAVLSGVSVAKGATVTIAGGVSFSIRMTGGSWSQLQLEAGTHATLFERRPIGVELALCQRYAVPVTLAIQGGFAGFAIVPFFFPVTMRAVPTVINQAPGTLVNLILSNEGATSTGGGAFQVYYGPGGGSYGSRINLYTAEL